MTTVLEIEDEARRLAEQLRARNLHVVFAESCTAGLVSAALGGVPGISAHHCGSAVTYRLDTKRRWLDVPPEMLENPGPVSPEVAIAMARGVLRKTPEADLAAAITGHLGPDAPPELDGRVYAAIVTRDTERTATSKPRVREFHLADLEESPAAPTALRTLRQRAAAARLLAFVREVVAHG